MSIFVAVAVATILVLYWRAALTIMMLILLALILLGLYTVMSASRPSPTATPAHSARVVHVLGGSQAGAVKAVAHR